MLRWQKVFAAAVLTASLCASACGDDAPAQENTLVPEGGWPSLWDAGQATPAFTPGLLVDAGPVAVPAKVDGSAPDTGAASTGAQLKLDAGVASDGLGSANPCGSGAEPVAANLKLRELALYQTVKIALYKDNAWVATRNAPVVQGKKSLVRAFVDTQTGFTPRTLRGVLALDNDGKTTVLTSERNITRASTDEASDSTFDFQVDGALLDDSTKLSISVLEMTCVPASAAASGARLPASGTQALNADAIGKLHVVLVPVTLGGRTPDTSEAQLSKVRDALRAYYPVADVDVTAHTPISSSITPQATGTGWAELLSLIGRQRQQDGVSANVYYFGWISPAASFREFCRSGCVLGLAPQTTVVSRSNQIGLGVGFVDDNTYTTIVHELGHAHGLPHAPCVPRGGSIEGADALFPYAGGKIGSWGWDSRSNKLISPTTYADVMGYCDPIWISDYNYRQIAARSKLVNNAAYVFTSDKQAEQTWHGVILYADGRARWSGLTLHELPGELSAARALDAQGELLSEIDVVRVPLSHSDDSFLYVPEPDARWTTLDLGDRTLSLDQIAPALP